MALRTRVAAGAATLALSLTGLAVAAVPANAAAPRSAGAHSSPDTFRMEYFYGTGGTVALAEEQAYLEAQMAAFTPTQCGVVSLTGQSGGYYVTILCESWS